MYCTAATKKKSVGKSAAITWLGTRALLSPNVIGSSYFSFLQHLNSKTYSVVHEERNKLSLRVGLNLDGLLICKLTKRNFVANMLHFIRIIKCKRLNVHLALLVERKRHKELHVHPEHLQNSLLGRKRCAAEAGEHLFFDEVIFVVFFFFFPRYFSGLNFKVVAFARPVVILFFFGFELRIFTLEHYPCRFFVLRYHWVICALVVLCLEILLFRILGHLLP